MNHKALNLTDCKHLNSTYFMHSPLYLTMFCFVKNQHFQNPKKKILTTLIKASRTELFKAETNQNATAIYFVSAYLLKNEKNERKRERSTHNPNWDWNWNWKRHDHTQVWKLLEFLLLSSLSIFFLIFIFWFIRLWKLFNVNV